MAPPRYGGNANERADEECDRIGEILFVDRSGQSLPRVIRKCRIGSALSGRPIRYRFADKAQLQ